MSFEQFYDEKLIRVKCSPEIYFENVKTGNFAFIKWLYDHGQCFNSFVTVRLAVKYGHTDIVSFIIDDYVKNHGSLGSRYVCIHDDSFIEASRQGNIEMYQLLRKYSVPNSSAFFECIEKSNNYEILNKIIREDQDKIDGYQNKPDYNGPKGPRGDTGCIGLHCMCVYPDDIFLSGF